MKPPGKRSPKRGRAATASSRRNPSAQDGLRRDPDETEIDSEQPRAAGLGEDSQGNLAGEALEPEVVDGNDAEDPTHGPDRWEDDHDALEASAGHKTLVPADVPPVPSIADDHSTALVKGDALAAYLAQLRDYPPLSREQEHELAIRYHETGDPEAAYRLITSNLRLVVMVAREYQRAFHNLLDLIQEGNVGLLEAVRQFDPYRGVRLPSYAVWWIRAYVIRYVMNNFRLVKVGTTQAQRRLFFNLKKERARLEALGFKPTAKMIAKNLGVKEQEVVEMDMRMGASEVSADAPLGPDTDTTVIDLLPQEAATAEQEVADREFYDLMRGKLAEFQSSLEGREYEIFTERLLADEPLTLQELGDRYQVSRERVRQIEESLRKRLREFLVRQVRDLPEIAVD